MSDPWPWSGDTPAEKARRVARSYRDRLEFADPDACARLDREMTRLGQRWVLPTVAAYTEDDLLPADLVADYAHVSLKAVYGWRKTRDAEHHHPGRYPVPVRRRSAVARPAWRIVAMVIYLWYVS